ncbi:MAG: hypothetical protein OEW33_04640 [Nitrospirota bacterium]|jgi:hypothetical protein|nr:hypothetical protein [Nitrospirota bacterium]MDH4360009.1 hypothetical protein [Nitrospirota bacterium]
MMRISVIFSGFLLFGALCLGSPVMALQSGGVEIGDLETGSVTGQAFKALDVDLAFTAMEIGGKNAWFPPTAILNLVAGGIGGRAGRPVLLQVTNKLTADYTFHLSADSAMAGPTSLNTSLTLKPGETKYIGIPMSDLTYVTANNLLIYSNPADKGGLSGQLLVLR